MSESAGEGSADRILSCVAGSDHRWDVLSTLSDESLDLRDLSAELGIPRTTLQHNVDKLQEHGLVEETLDREYRLTAIGNSTLVGLDAYRERVETATRLQPLFECVCPSDIGFDVTALSNASVTVARPAHPFGPSRRMFDALLEADSVVGVVPSLPLTSEDDVRMLFSEGPPEIDLAVTEAVVEVLEREFQFDPCDIAALPGVDLAVVDEEMAFGLVDIGDRALIQGLDDNGKPHVLVETSERDCREWVQEVHDFHQKPGTTIDGSEHQRPVSGED